MATRPRHLCRSRGGQRRRAVKAVPGPNAAPGLDGEGSLAPGFGLGRPGKNLHTHKKARTPLWTKWTHCGAASIVARPVHCRQATPAALARRCLAPTLTPRGAFASFTMALQEQAVRVMLRIRPAGSEEPLLHCEPGSNSVVLRPPADCGSVESAPATTPARRGKTPTRSARKL